MCENAAGRTPSASASSSVSDKVYGLLLSGRSHRARRQTGRPVARLAHGCACAIMMFSAVFAMETISDGAVANTSNVPVTKLVILRAEIPVPERSTAQYSYVPGITLVILRADTPLPERSAVESTLSGFALRNHFEAGAPMGRGSVDYGRDPDTSVMGRFGPHYINVLLWTDPDDRTSYDEEVSDLTATLAPLGLRVLHDLPVDPD